MRFIHGLSADMDDLLSTKGQQEARDFFNYVCWCMAQDIYEPNLNTLRGPKHMPVTFPATDDAIKKGDVVIVTDCQPDNTRLQHMIARFQAVLPLQTRIVNIREYPFRGGCLGCFNCAVSGKCIYIDGFDDFLRNTIQTAQAIIYAFTIQDHSMGVDFPRLNLADAGYDES